MKTKREKETGRLFVSALEACDLCFPNYARNYHDCLKRHIDTQYMYLEVDNRFYPTNNLSVYRTSKNRTLYLTQEGLLQLLFKSKEQEAIELVNQLREIIINEGIIENLIVDRV